MTLRKGTGKLRLSSRRTETPVVTVMIVTLVRYFILLHSYIHVETEKLRLSSRRTVTPVVTVMIVMLVKYIKSQDIDVICVEAK